MIDPNGLTDVEMLCEQIDHSAWWICYWLFAITAFMPTALKIKKGENND